MNLKTKAFGFAAATALTLSAASGAIAAVPSGNTSANLQENVLGDCTVFATADSIDLGDWMWDGDSYEYVASTAGGAITFTIRQTVRATPEWDCHVNVSVSDLTFGSNVIESDNIALNSGTTTGSHYVVSTPRGAGAPLVVNATLTDVPNDDIPQGLYTGLVSATASKSSS